MLCTKLNARPFISPVAFLKRNYKKCLHQYEHNLNCCLFKPCKLYKQKEQYLCRSFSSTHFISSIKSEIIPSDQSENKNENFSKQFVESESELHHQVLENLSAYSGTIFKLDTNFIERYTITDKEFENIVGVADWKNKSAYNVVVSFISLAVYSSSKLKVTVDDERFDKLVSEFVQKCSQFTEDQLIDSLVAVQFWPLSEHVKTHNYLQIWKALDHVCHDRYLDWTVDKMLFMMDLWYNIKLIRLSSFVYKGLNKISRKCDDLNHHQMIQTLFYMSCTRKLHPAISLREYEHFIQKHITQLSVEEIAIFSVAFFKTKTPILNTKILLYIMQRVIEEMDTIPEITLTGINKALRLSHKPEIAFTTNDYVKKLSESKLRSVNLINAIHALHISTKIQFYNEEPITILAEKFCSDPSVARLKDMERIVFILSLYNFIPSTTPDILDIIVEELDKPQHMEAAENHQLTMLSLVYFLTLLRKYPEKHIQHLLSDKTLQKSYQNKFMINVQALQIDYNRVLEGPPGSDYLLPQTLREYLARRYSLFLPDEKHNLNQYDMMMKEVTDLTTELLGGEKYTLITYPLPHFHRADILFRLDDNGQSVPIPQELRTRPHFNGVLRTEESGWHCVMVGGRNMYMYNVPKLVGEQQAKLRQLRLLGYTPIVIPSFNWQGEKNKKDYLRLKLFTKQ
uniref:RAP domain-containing protein n=1 Tax=Cuerna arida TaxID=1464854 RepID=A0A1B6F893_9HEMI